MNAPIQALSGDEAARRALQDLAIAGERGAEDGVSASAMARAIDVSPQQMARVLAGERKLSLTRVAMLPERAYSAVLTALRTVRRAPITAAGTVKTSLRLTLRECAERVAFIAEVLDDGEVDPGEEIRAEIELRALRDQIDSTLTHIATKRNAAVTP
jgi:hypothetical protein